MLRQTLILGSLMIRSISSGCNLSQRPGAPGGPENPGSPTPGGPGDPGGPLRPKELGLHCNFS